MRRTVSLINGTSFTDTNTSSDMCTYMVRAVKRENTPSGTYLNPSQGIFVSVNRPTQVNVRAIAIIPGGRIQLTWTSLPNQSYRVAHKNSLAETNWTDLSPIINATDTTLSWIDTTTDSARQRFYVVYVVN